MKQQPESNNSKPAFPTLQEFTINRRSYIKTMCKITSTAVAGGMGLLSCKESKAEIKQDSVTTASFSEPVRLGGAPPPPAPTKIYETEQTDSSCAHSTDSTTINPHDVRKPGEMPPPRLGGKPRAVRKGPD